MSAEAADDALGRLTKTSKGVELFERKALLLQSQLSKMETARRAAVSDLDGGYKEVKALKALVRMLCVEPNSVRH